MTRGFALTPALRARLASEGFVVRRAVRLSAAGEAPALRLDLDDGRVVRLRQFPTTAAATKVWALLGAASPSVLARPLLRTGRSIATEWVQGKSLDAYLRGASPRDESRVIRATGRLLAKLHHRTMRCADEQTPAECQRRLSRAIKRLGRRKLLNAVCVTRLVRLETPRAVRCALTHGDVCPENMVLAVSGGLRLIDEERLAVRPVAFDLARVVTRWPLGPREESELLAAYRLAGGDDRSFRKDRVFWIAVALASSAYYRLRYRLPGLNRVVADLRRL